VKFFSTGSSLVAEPSTMRLACCLMEAYSSAIRWAEILEARLKSTTIVSPDWPKGALPLLLT